MKKRLLTLSALVVALIIAGYLNVNQQSDFTVSHQNIQVDNSHIFDLQGHEAEETENPIERLEFELSELKNPVTGEIPSFIRQRELRYAKQNLNLIKETPRGFDGSVPSSAASTSTQTSNFINVGPFNVGGRTRGMGIDVANEDVILAGGVSGGMWRSVDAGATWARTTALEQHPAVSSLVQDTRTGKTNEWYYSTGERRGNSATLNGDIYVGNGIYKSIDNGASWDLITATAVEGTSGTDVLVNSRTPFAIVDELAIDLSNTEETEIYAAGTSEIIRSTDGFATFDIVLGEANTGRNATDIAITTSGKVFATIANSGFNGASGEDGFFESEDGINWTEIEFPTGFPTTFTRLELGIDPADQERIYVIGNANLFVYNDATDTWSDLTGRIDVSDDTTNGFNGQGGYDLYVAIHPGNSDVIFAAGTNIMRSLDGFTTDAGRSQVGGYRPNAGARLYPTHHPDQHDYAFYPSDPNRMISANDGGLYRTEDNLATTNTITPITWESLNHGYLTTQFYQIDIHNYDLGDNQIVGGMQDNSTWVTFDGDPTGDWTDIFSGDGAFSAITYNSIYVSSQRGNVARLTLDDSDVYRNQGNISPTSDDNDYTFINPYTYNPVHQDQLFVGARGRVFGTNDIRQNPRNGQWIELDGPNTFNGSVSALAMSTQPEGILYFGATSRIYKIENTRDLTTDTEVLELSREGLPIGNISGIAVDPSDGDKVIITFSNYEVISVWYSENGGESWSSISGNLEENPSGSGAGPSVRSVEIMPDGNGGNYYFAGTSVGLFMTQSLDGDNTVWTQQGVNEIGNVVVSSVKVRPIEGVVVTSTHGNGVFKGAYQVGVTPNINYSLGDEPNTAVLRGNVSFVTGKGMNYQWVKDGQTIEGETSSTLLVTDGGDYQLSLAIEGVEGRALSNTISFNFDGTGPDVSSITRLNPTDENTTGTTVQFQVTFSESVLNVDATDFETSGDASGTIGDVTVVTEGTVFNVTVNNIGGNGALSLDVSVSTDITDAVGNAFSGTVISEENYTIQDGTAPTAAITRVNPMTEITDKNAVTFMVEFTEGVQNVDVSDFALSTGSPTATLSTVTEFGTGVYAVEVIDIVEDGTLGLDFVTGQDIQDNAGNVFDGTVTTDETYTIQNVITSIDDPLLANVQKIIVDANPSTGMFNLAFPNTFIGDFEMRVVDAQGRVAAIQEVKGYASGDQVELNLTSSPDGLYVLQARNGRTSASIKLLKSSSSR
ncbi:glycoside hydrolase [Roseivirga sp. E12]|uniref:glycoside hydrolase n=1 Tax=Roseivirga sp. E12 TaxID=2819237 RepID=UPI001ABC84CB|nr:glycoside hydrolase [Roseivirga sp. E12]MBO3699218.1 exo-alpha-sialidase [Roseivirga sp. E12]